MRADAPAGGGMSGAMTELPMTAELRGILDALPPYAGNETAAPMLPRQCYTSPAFFEFEREAVFARNWVCVGRADQLAEPGACISVSIAGEPLLVARGKGGNIHAMGAVCRHRGHVLSCGGDSPPGLIRCPLLTGPTISTAGWSARRMGTARLRETVRCPPVRRTWHGYFRQYRRQRAGAGAQTCQRRALLGRLSRN